MSRETIATFSNSEAAEFCIRLWYELTIVGRVIVGDEDCDSATQLNALKWLNEIQHRVWGARARGGEDALMWLLDRIVHHCEQAPVLSFHIRVALDRSIAKIRPVQQDTTREP